MKKTIVTILITVAAMLCLCGVAFALVFRSMQFGNGEGTTAEETMSPEEVAFYEEWQKKCAPFMDMFEFAVYSDHVELKEYEDPAVAMPASSERSKALVKEIVVPAYYEGLPVTKICDVAFGVFYDGGRKLGRGEALQRIELPPTITEIGDYAFEFCQGLGSINMPSSLKKLGIGTFSDCRSLRLSSLPEGVAEIPEKCFYMCNEISEFHMPDSVTSIGKDAFYGARSIKKTEDFKVSENLINVENIYSFP